MAKLSDQLEAVTSKLYDADPMIKDHLLVFYDRLLLRVIESPSLLAYLIDAQSGRKGEKLIVQLDFKELPNEAVNDVINIIALDKKAIRVVKFTKEGVSHTGFEITVDPKLFPNNEKS